MVIHALFFLGAMTCTMRVVCRVCREKGRDDRCRRHHARHGGHQRHVVRLAGNGAGGRGHYQDVADRRQGVRGVPWRGAASHDSTRLRYDAMSVPGNALIVPRV